MSSPKSSISNQKTSPELLTGLIPSAMHAINAQLDAFAGRLANAFLALSEQSLNSQTAYTSFHAGQLLKKNAYAYFYLATASIEQALKQEISKVYGMTPHATRMDDADWSLVSFAEMDRKLLLGRASRAIELKHAQAYAALNMRLANMLGRESVSTSENPFRPECLLKSLALAWSEFDSDSASHEVVLGLLSAEIIFDLSPMLDTINTALAEHGILADLPEYRRPPQPRNLEEIGEQAEKLRAFLGETATRTDAQRQTRFFEDLAEFEKKFAQQFDMGEAVEHLRLTQIQSELDLATGSGERKTLQLLAQVFDDVLRNPDIPAPIKKLLAMLQLPVLKAALRDQEFFFEQRHPARRLIELLSNHGPAIDTHNAHADPLLQKMQKNVQRVMQDVDREIALFDEVTSDLEQFIARQEQARHAQLETPIKAALKQEKIKLARDTANHEVAIRVGTGEVVAFVETFLENRWVKVLTLAYSVKEDKPHALEDALRTMDDLIWSVRPKITLSERQELLNRLPAILARLNKWLSLIKWEDADRVRFFAELAECHASIVRAPLELSPERQVELAVEAAQLAAERRLEKQAQTEPVEPVPTVQASIASVAQLERGMWISYAPPGVVAGRVRLAWVSPMRSLFIFCASQKDHNFSLSAQELERAFLEGRAHALTLDKVVDRALSNALERLPEAA